ncbi:MAG TPA: TerC family protein [Planctomycetaceae bacterium]|nr:TerC family protein [Planctomycetaceae bacterium]
MTLTSLEIVLGIDNIIFIAILAGKLPEAQRDKARQTGLLFAVISRVLLLLGIGIVMRLKEPVFHILGHGVSWKDLVLLLGGLFLLGKSTYEIHHKVEGVHGPSDTPRAPASFVSMIVQVILIDIVFSLDSVITAVAMSNNIPIMIAAVITAVGVMLVFSGPVVRFVDRHPAIKLLALSFLLLIGVLLVAEGLHQAFDKRFIYFAMAFSLGVELLQMRTEHNAARANRHDAEPALHGPS